MIAFSCRCGQQIELDDRWSGRFTQCNGCGKTILVPAPESGPSPVLQYQGVVPPANQPPVAAGWITGAILLFGNAILQTISIVLLLGAGMRTDSPAFTYCILGIITTGALALGLLRRRDLARWLVWILSAIGAASIIIVTLSQRRIPSHQQNMVVIGAGAVPIGWLLLLDRRPTHAKVIAGAVIIVLAMAMVLGTMFLVGSGF
jgi:hypothetical protein